MEPRSIKTIDVGDLSILCKTSRLGEIKRRAVDPLAPGEEALIITSDPETWYSLANLGDELGYDVLESKRDSGKYFVRIRRRV
jgi:TusA-related sulfurtransferase